MTSEDQLLVSREVVRLSKSSGKNVASIWQQTEYRLLGTCFHIFFETRSYLLHVPVIVTHIFARTIMRATIPGTLCSNLFHLQIHNFSIPCY